MAAAGASGLYVNPNTGAAQAGLAPFRNALINGDMRINQRGTSTNLASLSTVVSATPWSWVADRWNVFRGSVVTGGVIGQGTNLTTSDLPFNDAGIKTFARVGRLSGNAATNTVTLNYNMESQDCYRFIGKTVTLSFYYRTGANFSSTSIISRIYTGTGTDQALISGVTGITTAGADSYNSNVSWQKKSLTCTLGTNINQIMLLFEYSPTGTAGAADYFDITGVQLELGSVATPFEVRPFPVELQLCQRYYQTGHYILNAYSTGPGWGVRPYVHTLIVQSRVNLSASNLTYTNQPGTTNTSGFSGSIYYGNYGFLLSATPVAAGMYESVAIWILNAEL